MCGRRDDARRADARRNAGRGPGERDDEEVTMKDMMAMMQARFGQVLDGQQQMRDYMRSELDKIRTETEASVKGVHERVSALERAAPAGCVGVQAQLDAMENNMKRLDEQVRRVVVGAASSTSSSSAAAGASWRGAGTQAAEMRTLILGFKVQDTPAGGGPGHRAEVVREREVCAATASRARVPLQAHECGECQVRDGGPCTQLLGHLADAHGQPLHVQRPRLRHLRDNASVERAPRPQQVPLAGDRDLAELDEGRPHAEASQAVPLRVLAQRVGCGGGKDEGEVHTAR